MALTPKPYEDPRHDGRKYIPEETKQEVKRLKREGATYPQIAKLVSLPLSTTYYIANEGKPAMEVKTKYQKTYAKEHHDTITKRKAMRKFLNKKRRLKMLINSKGKPAPLRKGGRQRSRRISD